MPTVVLRCLIAATALIGLCAAGRASAQVQRNYLNPGFESPTLTAANVANG